MILRPTTVSTVLLLSAAIAGAAPIALTPDANTYSQNFDGLATATGGTTNNTSVSFANDSTIPGFWAGQGTTTPFPAVSSYTVTDGGNGNSISVLSLGSSGATDRAFGARNSNATSTIRYGFVFQNTSTDQVLTSLTVSYTGEQWRRDIDSTAGSTGSDDTLAFSYRTFVTAPVTSDSSVLSGTVTPDTNLDFVSPQRQIGATTGATALDGNLAANRQALTDTITGLSVQPNGYIVIRWNDANISGNDNAIGIDDLNVSATFTATPEPASLGLVALGAMISLRRRRPC